MRILRLSILALAGSVLAHTGTAVPGLAAVPRMIFVEEFGATWCEFCVNARCAVDACESLYGVQVLAVENHLSPADPFETEETVARGDRFAVNGVPHVVFDGKTSIVSSDSCGPQTDLFASTLQSRLLETGELSPVRITGALDIQGVVGTISATFELTEPGVYNAHQATLFLVEDSVDWCCGFGGNAEWQRVVRVAHSTPVSLTSVGQQVTVEETVDLTGLDTSQLWAAAIYEASAGNKEVIQASDFSTVTYFHAMHFPVRVASARHGYGMLLFPGSVLAAGTSGDVIDLSLDLGGSPWPVDFQVGGGPGFVSSASVSLASGEERSLLVRVQTDGTPAKVDIRLVATSQTTGTTKQAILRVFNGSPSLLLVDDDNGEASEQPFLDALPALGYLYDSKLGTVGIGEAIGYDCVIWQSGFVGSVLNATERTHLQTYLDSGGRLFLSSLDFLSGQGVGNGFTQNYLGIASFTNNTGAAVATGVNGDPITDGMIHALTWPQPSANRVDRVVPNASAATILTSEVAGNPAAIRCENASYRTVFSSIAQTAFGTGAPAPNNSRSLIEKALAWLLAEDPAGVDPAVLAADRSGLIGVRPNPFARGTEVRFALSARAARAPISLVVRDVTGRAVRDLVSGPRSPGRHFVEWDGRDDSGRATASGVYFLELRTIEGRSVSKAIRSE